MRTIGSCSSICLGFRGPGAVIGCRLLNSSLTRVCQLELVLNAENIFRLDVAMPANIQLLAIGYNTIVGTGDLQVVFVSMYVNLMYLLQSRSKFEHGLPK